MKPKGNLPRTNPSAHPAQPGRRHLKSRTKAKKPFPQCLLLEAYDFFRSCPGLDFVFTGRDELADQAVVGVGPDLAAIPRLLVGALVHPNLAGPLATPRQTHRKPGPDRHRRTTIEAVEARVRALQEKEGLEFVLLWNVAGGAETHLDHSPGMSSQETLVELVDYLEFELQGRKTQAEDGSESRLVG